MSLTLNWDESSAAESSGERGLSAVMIAFSPVIEDSPAISPSRWLFIELSGEVSISIFWSIFDFVTFLV